MGFVNPLKDWRTLLGGEATLLDIVFLRRFLSFLFFPNFLSTANREKASRVFLTIYKVK